jgi:hypothetical protein
MDRVIRELVQIDQRARNAVRKAEAQQADEKEKIAREKETLHEQYMARVRETLEAFRREAQGRAAREMAEIQAAREKALEELRALYERNERRWAEEIAAYCVRI